MEHAVDDPPTDHRPPALTSVLVAGISLTDSVQNYMKSRSASEGGPVQRVYKLGYFTHVVDFHNHADAVNVVRRDRHSIEGRPVCVFLYHKHKYVYSGHQTVSWQGRKQVLHIPRVDPQTSRTVIVTGIPYGLCIAADVIKVRMEKRGNVGCRVKSVQCLEPVWIAIVEFERSEDAMTVVNMEQVTVLTILGECPVRVFVLRPLPSDPADIPNTAHTAIAGMPVAASAARVGQTQALGRNQAPGAPVTPPRDSRTMQAGITSGTSRVGQTQALERNQAPGAPVTPLRDSRTLQAGITSGTSRAEGKSQKEMSRVQDQTDELRRVKEQLEELRRAQDQLDAQMKAQVEDKAKMQSHMDRLEAQLRKLDAKMMTETTQLRTVLHTHQRQSQEAHTQHEAHQRQIQEQNEDEHDITSRLAYNAQSSLVRQMTAEMVNMRGQLRAVSQDVQALRSQLARQSMQGMKHRVTEVRGSGLEITNPSEAGSTSGRTSDED